MGHYTIQDQQALYALVKGMIAGIDRPHAVAHAPIPQQGWKAWENQARQLVDRLSPAMARDDSRKVPSNETA